jgi:hypothetical protein
MGSTVSIGPLKQAFVRALRDITALKTAVGNEFHEGVVLPGTAYPFCVYSIPVAAIEYDWDGGIARAVVDVIVASDDSVAAGNLDQLIAKGLQDKVLDFSGTTTDPTDEPKSTLLCRRITALSATGFDDAGTRVYNVGGRYSVETSF